MADEPTTLAELIEARAEELGDKPFLHFEDRVISFAELNRQVNRAVHGDRRRRRPHLCSDRRRARLLLGLQPLRRARRRHELAGP